MDNHSSSDSDQGLKDWGLLCQARDVLSKILEKELRPYGITPVQAAALRVIEVFGDKATPSEISRYMIKENNTTSALLSRMEKGRLISRSKDSPIRNLARVTLTEKGQQACYQSAERVSISRVMSALSQEEQQQLGLLLEKVLDEVLRQLFGYLKPPLP